MEKSPHSNTPLPALRSALEAIPIQHEGQSMILLRDTEKLSPDSFVLTPAGMLIASLLDGKRGAKEVQAIFASQTGVVLKGSEFQMLFEQLKSASLLETPDIANKRRAVWQAFRESPTRPGAHVGGGYPVDKLELAMFLGKFFVDPKGPGPMGTGDDPSQTRGASKPSSPVVGLFAPHIDFHRGGPAYAWAYKALAESEPPDVIVALGVAHMSPESPWVLTRKSYETPHGPMTVDGDLYDEIAKALWYDPLADEWAHRDEHSLEFQAVWLRYLWKEKTPPWVPILTSTFERYERTEPPSTVPMVDQAIQTIGTLLAARRRKGQNILILAGIDLAHVGPRFGDELPLNKETAARVEAEDRKSLEKALRLDADGFYRSVTADRHWRKVCGLSAAYTALRLLRAVHGSDVRGNLASYGQALDPLGGIVSFTSCIFR